MGADFVIRLGTEIRQQAYTAVFLSMHRDLEAKVLPLSFADLSIFI